MTSDAAKYAMSTCSNRFRSVLCSDLLECPIDIVKSIQFPLHCPQGDHVTAVAHLFIRSQRACELIDSLIYAKTESERGMYFQELKCHVVLDVELDIALQNVVN